jgi:hypothetical protein
MSASQVCRGHKTTHRTVGVEVGSIFLLASFIAVSNITPLGRNTVLIAS